MESRMDKFTNAEIKQALAHLKELDQECEDGTLDQHLSPSLGIAIDALEDVLAQRTKRNGHDDNLSEKIVALLDHWNNHPSHAVRVQCCDDSPYLDAETLEWCSLQISALIARRV